MIESADLFEAKIKRYFDLHFNLLEVDIANAFSGSAKSAEIKSISAELESLRRYFSELESRNEKAVAELRDNSTKMVAEIHKNLEALKLAHLTSQKDGADFGDLFRVSLT